MYIIIFHLPVADGAQEGALTAVVRADEPVAPDACMAVYVHRITIIITIITIIIITIIVIIIINT